MEPITREEALMNGDYLEPITREEMILAGEDIEPITRREWFLKKYRGGGDIEVVTLHANENTTYVAPEGQAYSPVVVEVPVPTLTTLEVDENGTYTAPSGTAYNEVEVDVPLPENAYLLKDVPDTPTAIATFSDGANLPMPKLEVGIEPVQEGSGDPSPENIRPISGWDEVNVTVADATTDPTVSNIYTIDLNGTRYGGKVDLVSGVMTVDRVEVDLGTLTYMYEGSENPPRFRALFTPTPKLGGLIVLSCYKGTRKAAGQLENGDAAISGTQAYPYLRIRDDAYTDETAFKASVTGQQLVYELVTPLTIQLTPTPVISLDGVNNVWADSGDVIDGKYFSKEV